MIFKTLRRPLGIITRLGSILYSVLTICGSEVTHLIEMAQLSAVKDNRFGDSRGRLSKASGSSDIKTWLEIVRGCKYLPEANVLSLIESVCLYLIFKNKRNNYW